MTALDRGVLQSYVSLGLGVGIMSSRAVRQGKDEGLVALDCEHLFPAQTTRLAYKRGAYLRNYTYLALAPIALYRKRADREQLQMLGIAAVRALSAAAPPPRVPHSLRPPGYHPQPYYSPHVATPASSP